MAILCAGWLAGRSVDLARIRCMGKAGAILAVGAGGLGALLGMILMLQNLDDPGALGPGMAVAALTSVYGISLAALVFVPMIFAAHCDDAPPAAGGTSTALLVSGMVLLPTLIMGQTWLLLNLSLQVVMVW